MSDLERLIPRKRGKGRLAPPPKREQIPARRVVTLRAGAEASGFSTPLTEQPYTGTNQFSLTSSDGLMVFEYGEFTDYLDAGSRQLRVEHINQDA